MLVFFLGFPLASAHPFLLDSEPGQGQNAPAGTTQIITNYSKGLAINFGEIVCNQNVVRCCYVKFKLLHLGVCENLRQSFFIA